MRKILLLAASILFAAPALAQKPGAPLSVTLEWEWRTSIFAASRAADFDKSQMMLEVYRTLRGAGVTLTGAEAFAMAEEARKRGLPGEAAESYALLNSDDPDYRQNRGLISHVQQQAVFDREVGLELSVEVSKRRASGEALISVAQAFAGQGEHERAIELYEYAISRRQPYEIRQPSDAELNDWAVAQAKAHGRSIEFYLVEARQNPNIVFSCVPYQFSSTELALARFNYGISLFRIGRITDARATWSAISGSDAVEILARAWLDIADRSAN